uniref:Pyridoxamine 5'-phosphate oxidase family protein n=1 Tax=Strongyloides papillosus TaxID=174720 RepID=A0A0N5CIZ0_STREA
MPRSPVRACSVVEHVTADHMVPGSIPGVPYVYRFLGKHIFVTSNH